MKYSNSTSDSEPDFTLTQQSNIDNQDCISAPVIEPDLSFISNCLLFETEG